MMPCGQLINIIIMMSTHISLFILAQVDYLYERYVCDLRAFDCCFFFGVLYSALGTELARVERYVSLAGAYYLLVRGSHPWLFTKRRTVCGIA